MHRKKYFNNIYFNRNQTAQNTPILKQTVQTLHFDLALLCKPLAMQSCIKQ